jgi:PII-like signaling protein
MQLNTQEARLLTVYRAIEGYDDQELVPSEDASALAQYLPVVLPLEELEKKLSAEALSQLIDGYIAGVAANRLMSAGIRPIDLEGRSEGEYQTGVDPVTKEVRVSS